jgi:hypothetical protein
MPFLNDNTLDNGLAALKAAADRVYLCNAEPATYLQATSTFALGNKNVAAGAVFPNAIAAGSPSGRKISTLAITDGVISAGGTASHWASVTSGSSRLEVAQALSATQVVTTGNPWSMPATDVRLANMGG